MSVNGSSDDKDLADQPPSNRSAKYDCSDHRPRQQEINGIVSLDQTKERKKNVECRRSISLGAVKTGTMSLKRYAIGSRI
jgi:hypothetical protein